MYEQFYNLHVLPFENTPDPRFFFASEQHREALAAIEYTIRMRKGFVLITGEIGAGKSTVGHTMFRRCRDRATVVQILHGHRKGVDLIGQLMRRLGLPCSPQDDHSLMLENLQCYLYEQMQQEKPVVLFVDEAQTLSDEALEELRLLSNLDSSTRRAIQVVLVGQPELRQRLRDARHRALIQRITMAKQLVPLNLEETGQYIAHRLQAARVDPQHVGVGFAPEAVVEIYRTSRGVPRLINVICDNCLLLGMVREIRVIEPAMVFRVVQDMVPQFEISPVDITGSDNGSSLHLAA